MKLYLAYNTKTKKLLDGYGMHATFIKTDYDLHVRAMYFVDYDTVYFRFFKPDGNFNIWTKQDWELSERKAQEARRAMIKAKKIKTSTKCLYWDTNEKITESMIKF